MYGFFDCWMSPLGQLLHYILGNKGGNSLHLFDDTHANLIAISSIAYWFSGSYLIGC